MNPADMPLLDLFNRLRDQYGWPLGIDEYMLALHALRAGFGVENRKAVEQLCSTLWAKSPEESRLLRRTFAQILAELSFRSREALSLLSESAAAHPASESLLATGSNTSSSLSSPKPASRFMPDMDEPVQVVQAVRLNKRHNIETGRPRLSLLTEYFPVTRRQMKQCWRHLRRPVREGPHEELDVTATVEQVGRHGILLEPVLRPRRINRAELVLLIDQDGSMVPFHALSRQLIETAQRGGRLRQAGVYYFHDYPAGYLYHDSARVEAQATADVLASIGEQVAVLIISDAGAARGHFDSERVNDTRGFIGELRQFVRYYAWLNPMPIDRWPSTSAGEIARFVPMFELSRQGLGATISALRGRYIYWKETSSWII